MPILLNGRDMADQFKEMGLEQQRRNQAAQAARQAAQQKAIEETYKRTKASAPRG